MTQGGSAPICTGAGVGGGGTMELHTYMWNFPVKTSVKCRHNRSDKMIWNREQKVRTAVEISCPADVNIMLKMKEKENIYAELMKNLQILHPD